MPADQPLSTFSIVAALGFTPANDASVLHLTGNETASGNKTFSGRVHVGGTTTADRGAFHVKQASSSSSGGVAVEEFGGSVDSFLAMYSNGSRWIIDPTYATTGVYRAIEIRSAGVRRLSLETSGNATYKNVTTAPTWDSTTAFQIGCSDAGVATLKLFGSSTSTTVGGQIDFANFLGMVTGSIRSTTSGTTITGGSGSSDPTTSIVPNGHRITWKNTTNGEVRDWYNDNGTMKKSAAYT